MYIIIVNAVINIDLHWFLMGMMMSSILFVLVSYGNDDVIYIDLHWFLMGVMMSSILICIGFLWE